MDTTSSYQTTWRELDSRVSDGIEVRLLWSSDNGNLSVAVNDTRTGQSFQVDVPDATRSMDVFHHPYAYAPAGIAGRR